MPVAAKVAISGGTVTDVKSGKGEDGEGTGPRVNETAILNKSV